MPVYGEGKKKGENSEGNKNRPRNEKLQLGLVVYKPPSEQIDPLYSAKLFKESGMAAFLGMEKIESMGLEPTIDDWKSIKGNFDAAILAGLEEFELRITNGMVCEKIARAYRRGVDGENTILFLKLAKENINLASTESLPDEKLGEIVVHLARLCISLGKAYFDQGKYCQPGILLGGNSKDQQEYANAQYEFFDALDYLDAAGHFYPERDFSLQRAKCHLKLEQLEPGSGNIDHAVEQLKEFERRSVVEFAGAGKKLEDIAFFYRLKADAEQLLGDKDASAKYENVREFYDYFLKGERLFPGLPCPGMN